MFTRRLASVTNKVEKTMQGWKLHG
jgi:hypothetical protein